MAKVRREIGIRDLKNNLSATLARVRRGETITVKDRKQAIARLIPATEGGDVRAVIEMVARSGRLTWSGGKPAGLKRPPTIRGRSVAELVVEDRR